jgi:1,4-alpha-glucan branching enzyme
MRHAPGQTLVIVMNFTPVVHYDYRIGAPVPGRYREVLNSDDLRYAGSGVRNPQHVFSEEHGCHGRPQSLRLTLPPLGGVILIRDEPEG